MSVWIEPQETVLTIEVRFEDLVEAWREDREGKE